MRQRVIILGGLLFIGILGISSCSGDRIEQKVETAKIVESVYSSVVVEPQNMYNVIGSVTGYIDEINVEVGQEIAINQLLFKVRDIQSASTANNARLSYELAKKNYNGDVSLIEDLKLELANAEFKRKNDSLNLSRNKQLLEKGAITKVEFEQSELMYENTKAACKSIENRIARTKRELKTSLGQAKNNYNSSMSRSDDANVYSNVDGVVYDIFKETGELVSMQEPIAIVGAKDKFTINMMIDEVDITKVKIGQTIYISLEAYRGQSFEAKVTHITPKMDARTQTFKIEGEFVKAPEKLFMGLTGEGNIVINEIESAVVIPREYLVDNKVETPNGFVDVVVGIKSLSHVQIISGLNPGDNILKPQ
ncbi:MAG: efflux RND transporter periplasmic adaptor subunit [Crocinitomicaceae bacterium]